MTKLKKTGVQLPSIATNVTLPPALEKLLSLLIAAESTGMNSLELQASGVARVRKAIYELRQKGAVIETSKMNIRDENNCVRRGIAHYSYIGWVENASADSTALARKPSFVYRIFLKLVAFKRVLSKLTKQNWFANIL